MTTPPRQPTCQKCGGRMFLDAPADWFCLICSWRPQYLKPLPLVRERTDKRRDRVDSEA